MRRDAVLLAAIVAVAPAGCGTMKDLKSRAYESTRSFLTSSYDDPQADAKVAEADKLFEEQQYATALRLYSDVAANTTNPVLLAEKARFMQAECYKAQSKYPEACDTYHKVVTDYPAGAFRERACGEMFKIADYWLDDTRDEIRVSEAGESVTALKVRRLFSYDRTKPGLDQEGRALQALEHVTTHDAIGPSADKALFWAGYVNFYRGRYEEADHFFSLLVEMHKDSPLRPTATELAIMCKNNSTGGPAYDGQKAAEALQLVHHAEASMPELRTPEKQEAMTRQKLAIRMQQAEKDYLMGQYWEQTGHPGSAFFAYEIVRRRYPGTKYADQAADRMAVLRQKAGDPKGPNVFAKAGELLNRATGRPPVPVGDPDVPVTTGLPAENR